MRADVDKRSDSSVAAYDAFRMIAIYDRMAVLLAQKYFLEGPLWNRPALRNDFHEHDSRMRIN